MFQQEQLCDSYWVPVLNDRPERVERQSQTIEMTQVDALLQQLAVEDLSPNKQAVIRQLLAQWLQDPQRA